MGENIVPGTEDVWQATCEQAVTTVVSLLYYYPRPFDTDAYAYASEATGFVVDAKRGIILTNRHVSGPGPFRGRCIFHNQEEADVSVIYYDPVHDFGFLKFDPNLKRMKVTELALRPDLLALGMDIRVIGNDATAKLSISAGTISRLNRNATVYGSPYSDFNTNYIQGSAMTSGGSSGSPVININGHAVALNSGSYEGASVALFLPLEQPLKALRRIINGENVPRGTIQTWWTNRPFHECYTLGLTDAWVARVQETSPDETGMLVAKLVLPGGPAESKIEEGDILLKVNDKAITLFNDLTDCLDSNVSSTVDVVVQRGSEEVQVQLLVGDLHSITPDKYLITAGSIFHNFSYILAQQYGLKVRESGVYMCHAEGAFDLGANRNLIKSIDGKNTPDLDTLLQVLQNLADGTRVRVTFMSLRDIHRTQHKIVEFDRRLCLTELAKRNFDTGLWTKIDLPKFPEAMRPPPRKAQLFKSSHPKHEKASYIINSLVWVQTWVPLPVDGFEVSRKQNYGLVFNSELGLVLASRDAVPHYFCRCTVMILNSIIVPCQPVFMHPVQNFVVLRYDPSLVQNSFPSARLSMVDVQPGDNFLFFRGNDVGDLELSPTVVAGVSSSAIAADIKTGERSVNMDILEVDTNMTAWTSGSGLITEDGEVQALYMGGYCVNTSTIVPTLKEIERGETPEIRLLGAHMRRIEMSDARAMGVTQEWIDRFQSAGCHQMQTVSKLYAGHTSGLQQGDVILTLDDKLVTRASDIFRPDLPATLQATLVRNLEQVSVEISTFWNGEVETSRIVLFCGATLHRPHLAARQALSNMHSEVYVGGEMCGTNASRYGLAERSFITHVDGVATPDLDSFLEQVKKIPDNKYFRLSGVDHWEVRFVKTIRKDTHYWPTVEYTRDPAAALGWRIVQIDDEDLGTEEKESTETAEAPEASETKVMANGTIEQDSRLENATEALEKTHII